MNTEGLTGEQILELQRINLALGGDEILEYLGVFVALPAMVVLIVWLISRRKTQRDKLRAELMAKAIEKGQTLPENFFDEPKKKRNPQKTGIICISVGIGLTVFAWLGTSASPIGFQFAQGLALGIIPLLIGVAFLIIHAIEKPKTVEFKVEETEEVEVKIEIEDGDAK